MKRDIKKVIGANIKRYRQELGLSQEDLANKADLHRTYIGGVERGERNITVESLQRITDALGVLITDIVSEEKNI